MVTAMLAGLSTQHCLPLRANLEPVLKLHILHPIVQVQYVYYIFPLASVVSE